MSKCQGKTPFLCNLFGVQDLFWNSCILETPWLAKRMQESVSAFMCLWDFQNRHFLTQRYSKKKGIYSEKKRNWQKQYLRKKSQKARPYETRESARRGIRSSYFGLSHFLLWELILTNYWATGICHEVNVSN